MPKLVAPHGASSRGRPLTAKTGDYSKPTFSFTAARETNGNLDTFSFAEGA